MEEINPDRFLSLNRREIGAWGFIGKWEIGRGGESGNRI